MKTAQEFCNERYKELCAQKADLMIRRDGLNRDIESLDKAIEGLNAHVPLMHQLESQILAQIEADKKQALQKPAPDPSAATKLQSIGNLVDSDT